MFPEICDNITSKPVQSANKSATLGDGNKILTMTNKSPTVSQGLKIFFILSYNSHQFWHWKVFMTAVKTKVKLMYLKMLRQPGLLQLRLTVEFLVIISPVQLNDSAYF